jgi:23S rRNA (guanosine2251-2'-O)-methyltransferase
VQKIYLSGYTPQPIDRFGRERSDLHKAALGAEHLVPWEAIADPLSLITNAQQKGITVIALEQDSRSIDYRNISAPKECLIVVGSEVEGVEKEFLEKADVIAEIPLLGKKESLNVTTALGVLLFSLLPKE